MANELSSEMIAQIVGSVFETMMSLEVERSGALWAPSEDRVTSAVCLSGDWNGAFLFECNRGAARRLAGCFLSMDAPEAVDEDVLSVLAELANMIGGNMKCAMMPGTVLSIPTVANGKGFNIDGGELRDRVAFHCAQGDFWVTILATPPERTNARLVQSTDLRA
jgi:CheY-specific phosphatase CheX